MRSLRGALTTPVVSIAPRNNAQLVESNIRKRPRANVTVAFTHLMEVARDRVLHLDDFFADGLVDDVASLAHEEITGERSHIGDEVDKQHAAKSDVVVDESDEGSGEQPSALNSC